jgi:hypothetical protein
MRVAPEPTSGSSSFASRSVLLSMERTTGVTGFFVGAPPPVPN